ATQVADPQARPRGTPQPVQQVADIARGETAAALADPAGRGPLERVQPEAGVQPGGLLGDGEFVAGVAVDVAPGVLDARLGAVAGVGVAADLQLEDLERRPVVGL